MATEKIIVGLVRRGGGRLIDLTLGKMLPADLDGPKKRSTLIGGLVGAAAVRIATRSVPGAIVVGGGLLAKTLYDRKRAKQAAKAETAGKTAPEA